MTHDSIKKMVESQSELHHRCLPTDRYHRDFVELHRERFATPASARGLWIVESKTSLHQTFVFVIECGAVEEQETLKINKDLYATLFEDLIARTFFSIDRQVVAHAGAAAALYANSETALYYSLVLHDFADFFNRP